MKLAIDATYSLGSDLSGVGVYSRELLHTLAAQHPDQRFHWYYRPHRFLKRGALPANAAARLLLEGFGSRSGLFHGLNQRLPQRRFARQVATFHDLFVLTSDYSTREFRERFAQQARHAAEQADLVIAVSQFTADQVEHLLAVENSRIRVVHHGVSLKVRRRAPEKIVLSVGAIQTRKNTGRLAEAFRRMPADWRLVLAGSAGYGAEEILEKTARDPRIHVTGYVSDETLADWYARASIFAFPSLDEGFGMPVLEAMAAGVPVITSNQSALPEIAGDAAVLVDPRDTEQIADALLRVAANPGELPEKGKLRAAQFSWQRAAEETWKVWGELTSLPQRRYSSI